MMMLGALFLPVRPGPILVPREAEAQLYLKCSNAILFQWLCSIVHD